MEELGPLFVHPGDHDSLYWLIPAAIALGGLCVASLGVLRGRLSAVTGFSGLIMVPCVAYLLGNVTLIERAKNVTFCGSCHPMAPVVDSLQGTDGALASIHYQKGAVSYVTGCYTCHGGYGIWGGARAKLAGMRHMWHTITGEYDTPLSLHGNFDINSCLGCHAKARPFREVDTHRDPGIQEALLSGEMSCVGLCHPMPHPEDALQGQRQALR